MDQQRLPQALSPTHSLEHTKKTPLICTLDGASKLLRLKVQKKDADYTVTITCTDFKSERKVNNINPHICNDN